MIGHRVIAISGARPVSAVGTLIAIHKWMQFAISGFAARTIANFVYSWPLLLTQSLQFSVMLPLPFGHLHRFAQHCCNPTCNFLDQLVGAVTPNTTRIKEQHQLIPFFHLTSQADTLSCPGHALGHESLKADQYLWLWPITSKKRSKNLALVFW